MAGASRDHDEAKLERLAKRLLSTPPEPREKAAEREKRKRQSASESEKGEPRKPMKGSG